MKKINPKDLEVNPKRVGNNSSANSNSQERAATVCTDENYGCVTCTLAIDCTVDTGQSVCDCPTLKDCVNTVDGCADTVSKGDLCCAPESDNINCVGSFNNCESKDYCAVTEIYTECDNDCLAISNYEVESECVCLLTDASCEESVDICMESKDCTD